MFLVVIAFGCSVTATGKLVREQHVNFGKVIIHRARLEKRNRSALIARVALRGALYPIVPFIANIWGFITQILVFKNGVNAPFELAMFGVVFKSMEGVLVAIIFFSDPTVTAIVSDQIKGWRRQYVEDYKLINVPEDLNSDYISTQVMKRCEQCKQESSEYDLTIDEVPTIVAESPPSKSIPVRCVTMPHVRHNSSYLRASEELPPRYSPAAVYRLSPENPHQLDSIGPSPLPSPLLLLEHPDKTKMYIPYRYPQFAVMMNCFLRYTTVSPGSSAPVSPYIDIQAPIISPMPPPAEIHVLDDVSVSESTLRSPDDNFSLIPIPSPPISSPTIAAEEL